MDARRHSPVIAGAGQLGDIQALLRREGLPHEDLSASDMADFLVIGDEASAIAVVGLERYGEVGLLRSLVVDPEFRSQGLGTALVAAAESAARATGIRTLYLLTSSASPYFEAIGYRLTARADAPPAIRTTEQFSSLCPGSAAFLFKSL